MSVTVASRAVARPGSAAVPSRPASGGARAMSVAIYLHDLAGGGVERQSLIIAEELRRRGADVTLVLHRLRGPLHDQVPAGLRVVDLKGDRTLNDIPRLARFLRRERPDVLLTNVDLKNVAALLAKAVSLSPAKVVICQHNPISQSFIAAENWLYRYVGLAYRVLSPLISRAVAVSSGVAAELRASGLSASRVVTIYNPVVGPDFQDRAAEAGTHPWFGVAGRPAFVTAGRLVAQKDHEILLHALALHRRHSDSRLVLLGAGPLEAPLRALADGLGLADAVDFAGFRPNVLPFFRQADAFVLSSQCEGFGNVIVEALGCGTPVISTDCDYGPSEILDGGRYGVLVPPRDAAAMAAAMDQVATLRARFPADALRRRAADFSYAACASRYVSVFASVLPHRAWAA
jgi:glycosyltransferase involved in cell wall biosynthesis